jgi:mRNA-degrading endonuclease RelE of RelBE toxin-antitoxin system
MGPARRTPEAERPRLSAQARRGRRVACGDSIEQGAASPGRVRARITEYTNLAPLIELKLPTRPEAAAKPLAHTTQRLWSLRVGDWRVVFALRDDEIWVLRIGHRREA